jgi:hypothetical protein
MDQTTPSGAEPGGAAQFTVDLGETELTDEEVSAIQHEITRLAVELVQRKRSDGTDKTREPFVKIVFVKAVHP